MTALSTGISGAESGKCGHHRLRDRHQCGNRLPSGGAGSKKRRMRPRPQGLVLNVLHGLILTAGCILIMPVFLRLFTADEAVISLGLTYSNIVFAFSVIIALGLAFEKIFQAVGKMAVSMARHAGRLYLQHHSGSGPESSGSDPFRRWASAARALATGLGQVLTLAVYLVYYFPRGAASCAHFAARLFLSERYVLKAVRHRHSRHPESGAAFSSDFRAEFHSCRIIPRLMCWCSAFIISCRPSFTCQQTASYRGCGRSSDYNYGAGEHRRVRSIYNTTLASAAVIMLAGTVLCQLLPGPLMGLFTSSPSTIGIGAQALRIISIGFLPSALSVASSGALEGPGKGCAVPDDFPVPLSDSHHSGRLCPQSVDRGDGRMARILDYGAGYGCSFAVHLSFQRETGGRKTLIGARSFSRVVPADKWRTDVRLRQEAVFLRMPVGIAKGFRLPVAAKLFQL